MKFGVSVFAQNYTDWDRYLSGDFSNPPIQPDHEIFLEDLELADLSESLGYDAIWATEHHFTPYELMPDALQFLTYFAGRTEKVGMATMVVVLPWHDPIRVAEQIAMLDVMLKGRPITLGFGRGAARVEFETFNIPMSESRERFKEAQEIITLALSQERFSYDGNIFKVPEMSIRPQPLSKDLPERIYISSITNASIEAAAESGAGLMIIPQKSWEDHIKDLDFYNSTRIGKGLEPRNPAVGCFMYCAETEAEVEQGVKEYMPNMNWTATRHYEFDEASHFRATKGYEAYADSAERLARGDPRASQDDTQVIGTPEQCLEKLRRIQEAVKPIEMFGMSRFGGMPAEKARKSLELFAKEVLPALHEDPVRDPITGVPKT